MIECDKCLGTGLALGPVEKSCKGCSGTGFVIFNEPTTVIVEPDEATPDVEEKRGFFRRLIRQYFLKIKIDIIRGAIKAFFLSGVDPIFEESPNNSLKNGSCFVLAVFSQVKHKEGNIWQLKTRK